MTGTPPFDHERGHPGPDPDTAASADYPEVGTDQPEDLFDSGEEVSPVAASSLFEAGGWESAHLVDSGHGEKLERFGSRLLVRPEPKAWWKPALPPDQWRAADARYDANSGQWRSTGRRSGEPWKLDCGGFTVELRLSPGTKHVGLFPEQTPHWEWMFQHLDRIGSGAGKGGKRPEVLNLFGYTGAASLAAASAGAAVTHVDASKPAVAWARQNQTLSRLDRAPIRWLLEDATKYLRREVRRGRKYQGILMDPPSFGRGPKGEIFKVEERLPELLGLVRQLIEGPEAFVVITLYNLEASSWMLANLARELLGPGQSLEWGELGLVEDRPEGRILPLSLFTRWSL